MKTGYDQHFKKIKKGASAPQSLNAQARKNAIQGKGKKEKKSFPLTPLFGFIIIAGSGLLFLNNFESIEGFFSKVDISMSSAVAADTVPAKTESADTVAGDQKSVQVEAKKIDDADYLFKLADRKKQLDQREEELNKVAAQIEKQKVEIAQKLVFLEEVRAKISNALQERIKADDGKVEVLVQMYTNMKPVQAAKIFEALDEDLVIEILSRMKKKNAADILNLVKAEKAQVLAERYTGYRTPAATAGQ